jgi:hypothetical protein
VTALPEHPASGRLSLMALCGDLVVAVDAMSIREIRRVEETKARPLERGMFALDLDGERVRGWDLGELLGVAVVPTAWVVVELPGSRLAALRVGRCVTVQSLPVCRTLPHGIFTRRTRALAAGFSTAGIAELEDHCSGVVLDLAHILGDRELASIASPGLEGREPARQA